MKKIFKKIVVSVLAFESRLVLKKYNPKIIAVTGSVGKTSTKDAIYHALSGELSVRKSEKSYNSEIGIPLTILNLPNAWNSPFGWGKNLVKGLWLGIFPHRYPEVIVLEAGVSAPGDMDRLLQYVRPDIAVVTRLAKVPVHVEFFDGPEGIYEEKGKLVSALRPEGLFIACGDDKRVLSMKKLTDAKTYTYGFDPEKNKLVGSAPEILYEKRLGGLEVPSGILFRTDHNGTSLPVRLYGTLGPAHMYSVLAGVLVGISLNLNMVGLTERFSDYSTPPGRMRIIEGIKNTTIIDDSYNSSPAAVSLLLDTFEVVETKGRKIAVLGDMLELGGYTEEAHKKAGKKAVEVADILVTVGKRARVMAQGALAAGMSEKKILQFEDSRRAGLYLQNALREGDVVAVKGSQGSADDTIRMERTVLEIMAHPEDREELLVRQDAQWQRR